MNSSLCRGAGVSLALVCALALACTQAPAPAPSAPEPLRVLSSNGVKSVLEQVLPDIERTIGHPLSIDFSTAVALKAKIDAGEPFDVAILTPAMMTELVGKGKIADGSPVTFARTGVGVGIREGAPVPDVSTPDAFKATLLAASSVAFTAEGQSRATVDKAYATLDVTEAMKQKSMLTGPGGGPVAVAEGKAELVLTLVSEILPVKGVRLVGRLPEELQGYVSFSAGRGTSSRDVEAADALLRYLGSAAPVDALITQGMEPVRP